MSVHPDNPNTVEQANEAFDEGGSWEGNEGRTQTQLFAQAFLSRANLPKTGTLLDFGCALGEFIPEVRNLRPELTLFGVDHSTIAIERAQNRYGDMAEFYAADASALLHDYDIIHSSNVVEHLDNAPWTATDLMRRCYRQYIMTPYREGLPRHSTHRASFYKDSFDSLHKYVSVDIECRVFRVPGAWGRPLAEEVTRRVKTLFTGEPFTEARQICYAITRRDAPKKLRSLRPFHPWVL